MQFGYELRTGMADGPCEFCWWIQNEKDAKPLLLFPSSAVLSLVLPFFAAVEIW